MHQRAFLGGSGWVRGVGGGSTVVGTGVVRRAHPASGAQWNVQVVKGKMNGKCLWNACKALSLGLLLMVLGAAMATIGYYADHLSIAQEVRGNHTVRVKNESRGFHLNNLSYAGPIVMGVGGFIVVAACVMTFEARDSAAKVVPARFKVNAVVPPPTLTPRHHGSHAPPSNSNGSAGGGGGGGVTSGATYSAHGSLRHSGSQTATIIAHQHHHNSSGPDRRVLTQSFMQFSRGLAIDTLHTSTTTTTTSAKNARPNSLKISQGSICKSPSAPDFSALERSMNVSSCGEKSSIPPTMMSSSNYRGISPSLLEKSSTTSPSKGGGGGGRKTFAACALLNPGLLHRHAVSVDETAAATFRLSHESLTHGGGSQGSMALDLHLECPVTLRVRDRRRNPLRRQRKVEEEEQRAAAACGNVGVGTTTAAAAAPSTSAHPSQDDSSRRSSHSCSPRMLYHNRDHNSTTPPHLSGGGSSHQLPTSPQSSATSAYAYSYQLQQQQQQSFSSVALSARRRSSNASDCTHRSRARRKDCHHNRGKLERAISSDSRLTGAIPKCHHTHHHHHHHHQQHNNLLPTSPHHQQQQQQYHYHHNQHRHSASYSPCTQLSTEDQEAETTTLSDTDVRHNSATKAVLLQHTNSNHSH